MGKDRTAAPSSSLQPKMDKFTIPGPKSGGAEGATMPPAADTDRFAEILTAIQASRSALEMQIGGVQAEVSLVRQDLRNVVDRVTATESRISELEDALAGMGAKMAKLESTTGTLAARAEDAENRARRNNLRFVGFLEGVEGGAAEAFLEGWLKSWMPAQALSACFVLERAHRSLLRRPPVGAPARPMIAKVLNYKDRNAILRHAREKGEIRHENTRIMIFPDYTTQVQKARKSYDAVKIKLRAMGLTYMLNFPSRLKVLHAGKAHFFTTPQAAWDWATETPNIVPNRQPGWGATEESGERGPETGDGQTRRPRRSRSRRNRRTDRGDVGSQGPDNKLPTELGRPSLDSQSGHTRDPNSE